MMNQNKQKVEGMPGLDTKPLNRNVILKILKCFFLCVGHQIGGNGIFTFRWENQQQVLSLSPVIDQNCSIKKTSTRKRLFAVNILYFVSISVFPGKKVVARN